MWHHCYCPDVFDDHNVKFSKGEVPVSEMQVCRTNFSFFKPPKSLWTPQGACSCDECVIFVRSLTVKMKNLDNQRRLYGHPTSIQRALCGP